MIEYLYLPLIMRYITIFGLFLLSALAFHQAKAQSLSSSNLPIILIQTNGVEIPDEPKITASMKIISNSIGVNLITDPPNEYDGKIGIEKRGASSQGMPQTPYAIETRDDAGEERNVSLFGMPSESDWCLIPNYNDKAFSRNPLSYHLFNQMGQYAPRTQLVEVVVNNNYMGIYLFCERIKRDKDRVNIKKADPTALGGDSLSGGYIFKIDYSSGFDNWVSKFTPAAAPNVAINYVFHYPKAVDLSQAQRGYMKKYMDKAETVLRSTLSNDTVVGYRRYFDTQSFIDYFLLNEVARNNDGSKKSRYFYKDRNSVDSLIKAGPVWDFDWAWKDIDECATFAATDGSGWSYRINDCNPDIYSPDLYLLMLKDTLFSQAVCKRYTELRQTIFATDYLLKYVDSIAALTQSAQVRHYAKWNILGYNSWTPEVNFSPTNFQGEVTKLKSWITRRMNWLDQNVPKLCQSPTVTVVPVSGNISVFPNPTSGLTSWNAYVPPSQNLLCADVLGRITTLPTVKVNGRATFDMSPYLPGIYFIWAEGSKRDAVRLIKN